jgi:hypothetical protein
VVEQGEELRLEAERLTLKRKQTPDQNDALPRFRT